MRANLLHAANRVLWACHAILLSTIGNSGLGIESLTWAQTPPTEITAQSVINELADLLSEGRRTTYLELSRLGFSTVANELRQQGGNQLQNFSANIIIESLYRRAEESKIGEGDRFLAVLYNDAAKRSAALSIDPSLAHLRKYSDDSLDMRKNPITFALAEAIGNVTKRAILPKAAENAISKLAEVYKGRGLAQARVVLMRNLQRKDFTKRTFDQVLSETKTPEEALRRMVDAGTPPPRPDVAIRNILQDTIAGSAALSIDRETLGIMEELSQSLPPEHERYLKNEDSIESRRLQLAEAARYHQPGKSQSGDIREVLALGNSHGEGSHTIFPHDPENPSATTGFTPSNGPGGGGGGGTGSGGNATKHAHNYDSYIKQTFESSPSPRTSSINTPIQRTSRSFSRARFSARAGRGVSAGASVKSEANCQPDKAVWLSNKTSDQFGRLFVVCNPGQGKPPIIAASRVLFADSYYAAQAVLWKQYSENGEEAAYHDGQILVLMSMDPFGQVTKDASQEAFVKTMKIAFDKLDARDQRRVGQLLKQLDITPTSEQAKQELGLLLRKGAERIAPGEDLDATSEITRLESTRGVVTHPALYGRELAWSTVRIDFAFNRLKQVGKEAERTNGGHPLPGNLIKPFPSGIGTWQYYELDSIISLRKGKGRAQQLVVTSLSPKFDGRANAKQGSSKRSHFAISMFGKEAGRESIPVEDGLYRRIDAEQNTQPLLDWLATNHHDFIRLNDFSEAFTLLRWVHSKGISPTVIDMDGQGKPIATPDRVMLNGGPMVGR